MKYQIGILSDDELFSEMLELEFSMLRLSVIRGKGWKKDESADVLIVDLDSARIPEEVLFGTVIGFSRHSALYAEQARKCALILHRPFEMQQLREVAFRALSQREDVTEPEKEERSLPRKAKWESVQEIEFLKSERILRYCGKEVRLTPQETRIIEILQKADGNPVSKEILAGKEFRSNEVEVHICNLRKKTASELIRTVRGKGYRLYRE